jgi:hypothetical protein
VEQALRLSARQEDPLLRARTRMSCFLQRVWARGWNLADAEACRKALAEIPEASDRLVYASHLIDYSFIQWGSSAYREAQRSVAEGLATLADGGENNIYLDVAYKKSYSIMPYQLFLGEWGKALRAIDAAIRMVEKNDDHFPG